MSLRSLSWFGHGIRQSKEVTTLYFMNNGELVVMKTGHTNKRKKAKINFGKNVGFTFYQL